MKILHLSPKVPYPLTDGGAIANFNVIKELAKKGHEVHLLALSREKQVDTTELEKFCSVTVIPLDTRTTIKGAIRALLSSEPYTVSKYWNRDVERQILDIAKAGDYELVHSEQLHMAKYGLAVSSTIQIPVAIREHNVESLILKRFLKVQRNLLIRGYAFLEYKKLERYQSAINSRADLNVMITEDDRALLGQLVPGARSAVVQAGVDRDYFSSTVSDLEDIDQKLTIMSIASMDWYPNVDAVNWFCDEVFPRIQETHPTVVFEIIGRGIPESISKRSSNNINVVGFVDDIRPYMRRATVMVVPLRIGGGMRVKILDSLAMGKAVVATSVGCEGIAVTSGRNIVVADSAAEFAQRTSELLRDSRLRNSIGTAGLRLVESKYSWSRQVALLADEYEKLIENYRQSVSA